MKKILLVALAGMALSVSTASFGRYKPSTENYVDGCPVDQPAPEGRRILNATGYPNFYFGVQAGYSDTDYTKAFVERELGSGTTVGKVESAGLSGRVFMGTELGNFFALELGYLYLPKVKTEKITFSGVSGLSVSFNHHIIDGVAKVMMPINSNFSAYAKGGMAWTHENDMKVRVNGQETKGDSDTEYVPVAAIGLSYTFDNHMFVDASFNRYFSKKDIRATNFYGIGLGYKFMNV